MYDFDYDAPSCRDSDDDVRFNVKKPVLTVDPPVVWIRHRVSADGQTLLPWDDKKEHLPAISTVQQYRNSLPYGPSSTSNSSKSISNSLSSVPSDDKDVNWTSDEELSYIDIDDTAIPTVIFHGTGTVSKSDKAEDEDVVEPCGKYKPGRKDSNDSKRSVSDNVQKSKTDQKERGQERKLIKKPKTLQETFKPKRKVKKVTATGVKDRGAAKREETQKERLTLMLDHDIPNLESLQDFLVTAEIKHEVHSSPLYWGTVGFKRKVVHNATGNDLNLQITNTWEEEPLVVIQDLEDFAPNLFQQIHRDDDDALDCDEDEDDIDAITWMKSVQNSCPGKTITLIISGVEKYFKKVKTTVQQQYRDRVNNRGQSQKKEGSTKLRIISRIEFKSGMVELQLETNITYRIVNNEQQLGKRLVEYLKAVADAPFELFQRKEFGFDWVGPAESESVEVLPNGVGLADVWIEQLRLFGNVGIGMAQAIAKEYPTPALLLKKYDECETLDEARALLQDITVGVGIGPLPKYRKVGSELSQKIYTFFNCKLPDQPLGSLGESLSTK